MGTNDTILIVDDEPAVAEVVGLYLKKDGFTAEICSDGKSALDFVRVNKPTLVVLDIMIPEMDGLAVLSHIRKEVPNTAVILLSARKQEIDRIHGLELGADDYMTKPFSPAELVARVKAVLRRSNAASAAEPATQARLFGDGQLEIDPISRTVAVNGGPIELTATEFNLLWFMAEHPNQVFTRDQLLEEVWGFSDYVDPNTVTVHMRRIREKVEDNPSKPTWLQTVWGVGYKFVA